MHACACVKSLCLGMCLLLFYAIAPVFQLYHGGDMMYEIREKKPEPTLFTNSKDLLLTSDVYGMV